MTRLSVTANTRDTKKTAMGRLRGCIGRCIGGTALVAAVVALGPCQARAQGTKEAGTLLGILLGLGHARADAQPPKGIRAESTANSTVPSGALRSSVGRASEPVKSGSVEAPIPPTRGMVWANVRSGVFHREGDPWYGETAQGKFMTEAEARKAGYRPPEEGTAGKNAATRAPG
jgi:hypothetical protein